MIDQTFLPIGTILSGRYKIIDHIGAGGFGITYLVEDRKGDKRVIKEFFISSMCTRDIITNSVAISVTRNRMTFKDQLVKFKEEACRINSLSHPNIVKVSGAFEENDTAYYVMDYVEGESLSQKIIKESISESQILHYMHQLLNALEYIHSRGMLHLDIKPGNVMIDSNDNVVLIDFGASKLFNAQSTNKTMMTSMRPPFTLGYASIEQENGNVRDMGPHCDIYSLGATLYTLYNGEKPPVPFEILQNGLPPISGASQKMQEVIEKSMAFMMNNRIKTVAEFRNALRKKEEPVEVTIVETEECQKYVPQSHKKNIVPPPIFVEENSPKSIVYNQDIHTPKTPLKQESGGNWIGIRQFLHQKSYKNTWAIVLMVIIAFPLLMSMLCAMGGLVECDDEVFIYSFFLMMIFAGIELLLYINFKSPILSKIQAIEQPLPNMKNQVLRIQNRNGKMGICRLGNFKVKELLPLIYDAIYPYDNKTYVCVVNGKKGVYNVALKRMVIPIVNDDIKIMHGNQVIVNKDGFTAKYTLTGIRVA